jgi:hypothetical protein
LQDAAEGVVEAVDDEVLFEGERVSVCSDGDPDILPAPETAPVRPENLAVIDGEDLSVTWKCSGYCRADRETALEFSIDADATIPFDVSAGIKCQHFRRFCSRGNMAPLAGTRYSLSDQFQPLEIIIRPMRLDLDHRPQCLDFEGVAGPVK